MLIRTAKIINVSLLKSILKKIVTFNKELGFLNKLFLNVKGNSAKFNYHPSCDAAFVCPGISILALYFLFPLVSL